MDRMIYRLRWVTAGAVALLLVACNVDSPVKNGPDVGAAPGDTAMADAGRPDISGDTGLSDTAGPDTRDAAPDTDGLKGPPYPIVLSHGLGGFEHLADVEQASYYFQIPSLLREKGESVYVAEVDPFNDSYYRGRQLLDQIEAYLDRTGYRKVNIIAHSQGGLDSRWVAHHAPAKVASVVTISSPHSGTLVSDVVLGYVDHPLFRDAVDAMVKVFGAPLYDKTGAETSVVEAVRQFSEDGIEEFNRKITDQPGVFYASVAGRSDGHLGREQCRTKHAPKFIEKYRYNGDPIDPILSVPEAILDGTAEQEPNDGMVRVADAKLGRFLGCIPADHFDQVGHLLGDPPGGDNPWDYKDFYVNLVDYLHEQGY